MKSENTIFSITAHLDLLGFSNHLVLSNYDLRTKIGNEAIQRLRTIEAGMELIESELHSWQDFYPETFRYMRFNDSLILGVDIDSSIMPSIGKPNETVSVLHNAATLDAEKGKNNQQNLTYKLNDESFKICKFLGIVSRLHNYINLKEFEMQMPGCRTIVSSGLRYRFINKKDGREDYYSANFSFSNAYRVNELGTKNGFGGNRCYIENNVAIICGYNIYAKKALGFSKFSYSQIKSDPFDGKESQMPMHFTPYFEESIPIYIDLFNKKYCFRNCNTYVGSNLQLLPQIIALLDKTPTVKNSLEVAIVESLKLPLPNIGDLNQRTAATVYDEPLMKYPLLLVSIGLEHNISDALNSFKKYYEQL